jgi:C-terminal processing protease CtpA/Prc
LSEEHAMKRTHLWAVAAAAVAISLPGYQNRLAAQQSADAAAEAGANQAEAEGSAENGATAEAEQQSSTQSDAQSASSTEAANQAEAQSSTSTDAASEQAASADTSANRQTPADAATTDQQPDQSAQPSLPPTAPQRDARATEPQDRAFDRQQRLPEREPAIDDRTRTDTDISVQGRADLDARARQGGRRDLRGGIHFDRATDRGLVISDVERDSVFFHSGFRRGDVIVSLHGRPIRSEADFMRLVVLQPGQRVPVVVLRDGRRQTIYVAYPRELASMDRGYAARPIGGQAYLGVVFDAEVRDAAVLRSVSPGSPADEAGLQPGDLIIALNGEQVMSYPDAISIIRSMRPGERLDIFLERGRSERQTEAVLAGQPGRPVRTAARDTDVYIERQVVPAQPPPQPIIIERDDDDRGIFNRDRDRPLRRRLID